MGGSNHLFLLKGHTICYSWWFPIILCHWNSNIVIEKIIYTLAKQGERNNKLPMITIAIIYIWERERGSWLADETPEQSLPLRGLQESSSGQEFPILVPQSA